MSTTLYNIIAIIYIIGGSIVLAKGKYPLWGKQTVSGQPAQTIGLVFLIAGVASFVGYTIIASLPRSESNLLRLVIQLMQLGVIIYTYRIYQRHKQDADTSKVQHLKTPDVFTVREAAQHLKVEEIDILHLIEDGDLKAKRIGGDYRISKTALDDYLQS